MLIVKFKSITIKKIIVRWLTVSTNSVAERFAQSLDELFEISYGLGVLDKAPDGIPLLWKSRGKSRKFPSVRPGA